MSTLLDDLKYAFRTLLKQPSFTAIALCALALGIGASTAVFSVVYGVILRPLDFPKPDELAVVLQRNIRNGATFPVAPANYVDLARQTRTLSSIGAAEAWSAALTGDGPPENISGLRVTASLFEALGTKPALGRLPRVEEETPGQNRVVVLTDAVWKRRFGADNNIAGRTVQLSGEPFEIIGVMPPGFRFPPFWAVRAEIYTPLAYTAERYASRGGNSLRLFARLRPGTPVTVAQAELDSIGAALANAHPNSNRNSSFAITPLHEIVVGKVRLGLWVLLASVGLVLLIACANVANLLLARGLARRKEIAVRAALGAGQGRILRLLLTESVLLSSVAGFIGLTLSYWLVELIRSALSSKRLIASQALPRLADVAVDTNVLLFALAASVLTGILFGIVPALHAAKPELVTALRETARNVHSGGGLLRRALVATEVALTIMLLVGAGLLTRSFVNMLSIDPGFRSENLLTANISVTGTRVAAPPERQLEFYRQVLDQARSIPGVVSAGAVNHLPLAGDTWDTGLLFEDRPAPPPGERYTATYRMATPGYFTTMGTRILSGRELAVTDVNPQTPVAVINETMAKRFWPNQNAVGKRLRTGNDAPWVTVVGVSQDVRQREWIGAANSEIYLSYLQQPGHFSSRPGSSMTFVLRTSGDPRNATKSLEQIVWSADSRIPFNEVLTMDEVAFDAVRQPRLYAFLLGFFALTALVLATVGLYGVISYTVAQRTPEMGVRLALGASSTSLVNLLMTGGLQVVAIGAAIGLAGSLAMSQILSTLLFGLKPNDLTTLCGVTGLLLLVSAAAIYIPARRIARIDPAVALRFE